MTFAEDKNYLIDFFENFLSNSLREWDIDDFVNDKFSDPMLEGFRREFSDIPKKFPSCSNDEFCSLDGLIAIRDLISRFKQLE